MTTEDLMNEILELRAHVAALSAEKDELRLDVVRMATTLVGDKCEHHKSSLEFLEWHALKECPICWQQCAEQAELQVAAVSARLAQVTRENDELKAENGTLHETVRLAAIPITRHLTAKAEIARLTTRLANAEQLIERWREDVQAQAALHQERLAEGSTILWQHFTSTECAIEHCIGDLERALATPADPVTRRTP